MVVGILVVVSIAGQLLSGGKAPDSRDVLDEALHMISCKAAIKAGDTLSSEEVTALLADRERIDDTHHCPHGRPTSLVFSRDELLERVWPKHVKAGPRTVDVHVRRVRQALERFGCDDMIQTVRGFGYRFSTAMRPPRLAPRADSLVTSSPRRP